MNDDSSVIRTYLQLKQQHYMEGLAADQQYEERALFSTSLTQVAAAPLISIRTAAIAAGIGADYCSFIWLQQGHGYWFGERQQQALAPDCVIFIEASRPFTFHFDHPYRVLSFNLPRLLLDDELPQHGRCFRLPAELAVALQQGYAGAPAASRAWRQQTEQTLLAAFRRLPQLPDNTATDGSLALVQRLVSEHLQDEELSVDWLVARSGFSRRYLFKLFSDQPETLSQCIFRLRLEHAYRQLTDPHQLSRPVNHIALDAGFRTQAHFSRLFSRRFHATPSRVRQCLQQTLAQDVIHYG
ncbi:MAG: helix-turn-helix domain-containing protein [Pseudomonadota bacterium]|nr:helix-turn-helix domain-containing protein [Pseudomonadota bacterium]